MDSGIKVGDIMTRNFVYVTPDTNLRECAKTLIKKKVGSLIIKRKYDDKLLGILTEKDIIWAVVKKSRAHLKDIPAKAIMKRKVYTVKPSADVLEAMKRFRVKNTRKLPVVHQGRVVGMLTQKDILRIDPGLFEMISESIKIREEAAKLKAHSSRVAKEKDEEDEENWDEYGVF